MKYSRGLIIIILLSMISIQKSIACTPLAVPTINNYTVVGNNLILNSTLNNVWICTGYFIQVELTCNDKPFTGAAPFFFQSAQVNKTSTPFVMPQQTIPLGPLCAGTVYKFRIREGYGPFNQFSGWTAAVTFTTGGTFVQPVVTVTPNPVNICPPQTQQLTATISNTCGGGPVTYTWSPATGLSCVNCPNPIASPNVSTTYTVRTSGGTTSCWTASTTVAVNVITVAPVVGTVTAPLSVCYGETATVAINTFSGNLQWYSSATANGPWAPVVGANTLTTITPTLATTACYHASVIGCPNTLSSNTVCISVNPIPTITVNSPEICQGFSATLTANGAGNYTWSAGANITSPNSASVMPAVNTSYTVTGSALGCTSSAVADVTVHPTPVLNTSNVNICVAENLSLTATSVPGATFAWSGPLGFNSTQQNPVITNAQANMSGQYTVVATSTAGCIQTAFANVQVIPLPTVSIVGNNTVCSQSFNNSTNTVALGAGGAANYAWTLPAGFSAPSLVGNNIVVTPPVTGILSVGTISVVGTTGTCSNSTTFNLNVFPNPTISTTSGSMCAGTSATITASGATTYTWAPSQGLSTVFGSPIAGSPTVTSIYSVIGTSVGCNSTTETATIVVVPNPTVSITPFIPPICAGTSAVLNANGATNYTWIPSVGQGSVVGNIINITPMLTTSYLLIGEANTCTSTAVQVVTVIPLPTLIAVADKTTICSGESSNINANGASSYTWSPSNTLSSANSNFVSASPPISTNYTLIGNNGICTSSLIVPINVVPKPILELSINPNKICQGNSSTIFASGATNYLMAPGNSLNSTTSSFAIASPSVSTNYTVVGYNSSGTLTCSMTKEILLEVVPQVTASVSNSATICQGQSVNLSSGGSNTYLWLPPDGLSDNTIDNPVASPSVTTLYTVNVSNFEYCGDSKTVLIKVNPTPTVNAGVNSTFNSDEAMHIEAKGTGTLSWVAGEGIYCYTCPLTQVMPKSSGCYRAMAINEFGCKAFDDVCIEVTHDYNIYIPNVFTPNEDGLNDTFKLYGTGISDVTFYIFDRWGELIHTCTDNDKGWDGFHKGKLCKNDVYVYLANFTSLSGKKHTHKGHVTLLK